MEKPDFVAIDFEHSTTFRGSVCSVGIMSFKDGKIIDDYSPKIQPPNNYYLETLSYIHKLTSEDTIDSPTFTEIYPEIKRRLEGNVVVAHNAIPVDKACLEQAMGFNHIKEELNIDWQCTYKLTNVKLKALANVFDLELDHHEAGSDARVCGEVYNMHFNKLVDFNSRKIQDELEQENEILKHLEQTGHNSYFYSKSLALADLPEEDKTLDKYTCEEELTIDLIKDNVFMITGELMEDRKIYIDFIEENGGVFRKAISGKVDFVILGEDYGHAKLRDIKKLNETKNKNIRIILSDDFEDLFLNN